MNRAFNIIRRAWDVFAYVWGTKWEGANWSTKRSQTHGHPQSARLDMDHATRMEVVERSRQLEKNDGLFNRLCDLFELYTVGSGLVHSPSSSNPDWNTKALASFQTWSRYADLTSRQGLGTMTSMWARAWFVDGEVFIVKTHGEPDADGRRRPRLQTFETHLCETPPQMAVQEGKTISEGIEIDPRGRPIAFHFRYESGQQIASYMRVPAEFVLHLFEPSRPGQLHGYPFAYSVLNDFIDLHEIDALEMEAAKYNARRVDIITTADGKGLTPDAALLARMRGGTAAPAPNQPDPGREYEQATGIKSYKLRNGEDVKQLASQRPSVVTQEYYKARQEKACAGVGIPRVMAFPESMQGTVYRGAMAAANAFFKARFSVIAEMACRPVYEFWASWAKDNERPLFNAPADFLAVKIAAPKAPDVDVGRNSAAMLAELAVGATNYDRIYGPLGLSWREEFDALREQQEYAATIGLVLPGTAPTTAPSGDGEATAKAEPLNGAQITAAIDVMVKLREQTLAPAAALELLVGIGIDREKAEKIVNETPIGMDNGAGDTSFKREVLKALLAVPAAREAVYNGTDIEDLISQTGLTPEQDYEAPFIPVVAPTGPLVSGDTIKDRAGEIVGGDIKETKEKQ
jgi:capsid protein